MLMAVLIAVVGMLGGIACTSAVTNTSYQKRISGPLIDRIDIHVDVPRVNYDKLAGERQGEPSRAVRERVTAARQRQAERFKHTRLLTNADMGRPRCAVTASSMAQVSG